jgi:hypothetical protein
MVIVYQHPWQSYIIIHGNRLSSSMVIVYQHPRQSYIIIHGNRVSASFLRRGMALYPTSFQQVLMPRLAFSGRGLIVS